MAAVGRSEGLVVAPVDPLLRITQLEQNIRFLQDQHKLMLTSLHQEVEQLRQRNRGKHPGDIHLYSSSVILDLIVYMLSS